MTDLDLLRQYALSGCQQAFGELVRRHVDMVYAVCLRRLRNRQDAEDATQAVFIALAGKAAGIADTTVLGGWLYRAAGYICSDMRRKAKRREEHEMAAAIEKAKNPPEPDPQSPDIDDALARLDAADRDAIVLRFLEDRSFREVGVELQISEEAARKRVSRALQRLRGALTAIDGTALSLAAVESLLHACLHPAPPGLVAATTRAALAGHAARSSAAALTKGAATIMAATHIKLLAGAAALALLGGGAFVGYKMMAPPTPRWITMAAAPNTQITSVSTPDWQKRFIETYQLAPGQIVKFVDRVPVPERLQYWKSLPNNAGYPPLNPECTLVFKSNGSDLHWVNLAPNWIPLAWAIQDGAGLHDWQIDGSIPQGMKFTGDWVFRENATPEQIMDALAALVSQRLGRQVRFVKRLVVRDALIVQGNYKFVPLAGYPNDNIVQLTDRLSKHAVPFVLSGKLADLFDRISMAKSIQVIDETGSGKMRIRMCDQQNWHDADAFFRTVAAQTSLHFDREPRQIDVWFMVNSNAAQPQTQPSVASN